jgi:hypothetical protein
MNLLHSFLLELAGRLGDFDEHTQLPLIDTMK